MDQLVRTHIAQPVSGLGIQSLAFDRRQLNFRAKVQGTHEAVGTVVIVVEDHRKVVELSPYQLLRFGVLGLQNPPHLDGRGIVAAGIDQVKMWGLQLLPLLVGRPVLCGIKLGQRSTAEKKDNAKRG